MGFKKKSKCGESKKLLICSWRWMSINVFFSLSLPSIFEKKEKLEKKSFWNIQKTLYVWIGYLTKNKTSTQEYWLLLLIRIYYQSTHSINSIIKESVKKKFTDKFNQKSTKWNNKKHEFEPKLIHFPLSSSSIIFFVCLPNIPTQTYFE